jgi:hypothetical protein
MRIQTALAWGICAAMLATGIVPAQVAIGTPPFGSFGGGPFDTVNLGNLDVHFVIPAQSGF